MGIKKHALLIAAFSVSVLLTNTLQASPSTTCSIDTQQNQACAIRVMDLYPTQLTYGETEVNSRSKKIDDMSPVELDAYIKEHLVPLVIGPWGHVYITDHHHFALALAKAKGEQSLVLGEVIKNWSALAEPDFWEQMRQMEFTYLYDENGIGPKPHADLPSSLLDLKNDSYRSLAWGVRKKNGYQETSVPHADFLWANYFRNRIAKDLIESNFKEAVKAGVREAHDPAARSLPGYTPGDLTHHRGGSTNSGTRGV